MIALTLAKAGFYGGSPDNVYNARVDLVMQTYHYELFMRDFESTYHEINKKKGK